MVGVAKTITTVVVVLLLVVVVVILLPPAEAAPAKTKRKTERNNMPTIAGKPQMRGVFTNIKFWGDVVLMMLFVRFLYPLCFFDGDEHGRGGGGWQREYRQKEARTGELQSTRHVIVLCCAIRFAPTASAHHGLALQAPRVLHEHALRPHNQKQNTHKRQHNGVGWS
jgi:hypothetical protein